MPVLRRPVEPATQNGHQPILRRALELTNLYGQHMRYASLVDFREDATPARS
jgi:hypothetical protein